MIKSSNGEVIIKGEVTAVATDFTVLTKEMIEAFKKSGMEKEDAEDLLRKAFELAFKSEKEIRDEASKIMKDFLRDLLSSLDDEEEEGE